MIVMVHMKNVIRRGETYCFRMRVPKDCVDQIGKKEIVYSLKTKNDREAQAAAEEMPDRHAQEITGHAIEGVSAVHLGYSGPLKPAVLLEELQKVKYG